MDGGPIDKSQIGLIDRTVMGEKFAKYRGQVRGVYILQLV